ncbi:hypothetical protein FQA47_019063 [Oryzias melastigma]|uniref:Uncharacterized protein n=1 Tax=Oryzias melastigma TaxID=30732 RepID=A0A834FK14_ORYME|nr:hypothetical protein FQA47_019063 [Oryzias melastigma]
MRLCADASSPQASAVSLPPTPTSTHQSRTELPLKLEDVGSRSSSVKPCTYSTQIRGALRETERIGNPGWRLPGRSDGSLKERRSVVRLAEADTAEGLPASSPR